MCFIKHLGTTTVYCTAITCTTFCLLWEIFQVNVKSAWLLTVVICCYIAVADLAFPRSGAPTPKMGAPTYYLIKISQKLAWALLMHWDEVYQTVVRLEYPPILNPIFTRQHTKEISIDFSSNIAQACKLIKIINTAECNNWKLYHTSITQVDVPVNSPSDGVWINSMFHTAKFHISG